MGQIDPPIRKHSKVINGHMNHYDQVRNVPIIKYRPIDLLKPEKGIYPSEEMLEVPIDPDIEGYTKYWEPEMELNPTGCKHNFVITDIGKREVECENCHWAFAFHAGRNYFEEDGKAFVMIKNKKYPLSL